MPLQLGVWHINVNGTEGDLNIQNIDAQGIVTGSLFAQQFRGLWDEVSQTITFLAMRQLVIPTGLPPGYVPPLENVPHSYRGYLFSTPPQPQPGQDIQWTLAGSVVDSAGEAVNGIAGTARRNAFGWFAQFTQVV